MLKRNRSRVVMVSSCANYVVPTLDDFRCWLKEDAAKYKGPTEDFLPFGNGFRYYFLSKLSNVLMARHINQLYGAYGITALVLHPGCVATKIARNMGVRPALLLFQSMVATGDCVKFSDWRMTLEN